MKFARIPAQSFLMGSDDGRPDERPVHRVWIDAFEIGVYQVTNAEYAAFANATGHAPPPTPFNDPEQPVVARVVVRRRRLLRLAGRAASFVCRPKRSGSARRAEERKGCAIRGATSCRRMHAMHDGPRVVGRGTPNAYGLYDICENVHEWCSDWYAADFYGVSPERNPRGPDAGTRRVIARRLLAASDQVQPLRRAVEHSAGVSVRGLRLSGRARQ